MKKKISIIIPCYNAERFICDNLNVLCKKKYLNKIEVILVDDGSKDNTKFIISNYIDNNTNFSYIYQNNSGAPTARNNGLKHSNGEYIIFLDADDILNEESLDYIISLVEKESYDLIVGNFEQIDEQGNFIKNILEFNNNICIYEKEKNVLFSCDPKPGSKVYNKSVIDKYNIYFDDLKIGQDLNFYLKYLLFANKIYITKNILYKYRIVNGSISRTYSLKILKIKESFEVTKKFYESNNSIDIYNDYIEIIKALRFHSQFCKIRYMLNRYDRKISYYFFKKEFNKIKLKKSNILYKKNKKTFIKIFIRLYIGWLYTTNLYCFFYRFLKGDIHNN